MDIETLTPEARRAKRLQGWIEFAEDFRRNNQQLIEENTPRPRGKPTRRGDHLYFIGSDTGPIKIGSSANPEKRLKALQTSHPYKLRILAIARGEARREGIVHCQFAAHRLEGEWFDRHPDILAEIDRLNTLPHHPGVA